MKTWGHLSYGLLGLPLAMATLPIYVQLPSYYTNQLGLPMAMVGYILFFTRIFDTAQDPLLGLLISRYRATRPLWYIVGGFMMSFAFTGLWIPPEFIRSQQSLLFVWIAFMLFLAYSSHSLLNIAYLSWGAGLNTATDSSSSGLLGAATWREGFGLVGVIFASIAPAYILNSSAPKSERLLIYASIFVLLLLGAIVALLQFASRPNIKSESQKYPALSLRDVLLNKETRPLFLAYFINSLAIALPASLMLFFVEKQIGAVEFVPQFLVSYFVSGAVGLPSWLYAAKKFGSRLTWQCSLIIAMIAFIGAGFVSNGDILWYTIICISSGLCLGADLVLPPVLLSEQLGGTDQQASYFGVWTFLGKIALATSGLSLPLLDYLQKQDWFIAASTGVVNNLALVLCYALIPCALKILTFIFLLGSPRRISS